MSRMKLWLVVGLALAVAAPVVALDDEEKKVRRIEVKKIKAAMDCEGDDCPEAVSRVLFVGDDGDVRVLHGDDNEWVAEDNVRILEADGHEVVLIEAHEADGDDVVLIEAHEADGEAGESIRHRVHRVMQRLGERGSRLHLRHGGGAFLGVQPSDLTPELRTHFSVPEDAGVMIGKVVDGSPAFRAGLEVGDIVTAIDGEVVASATDLLRAIRAQGHTDTVVLEVWRDGQMQKISAALEERERRPAMSSRSMSRTSNGQTEERVIEVTVDCEDGEDCTVDVANANSFEFAASACGDSGECEVNVDCTDGDCACTVNGAAADCSELGL